MILKQIEDAGFAKGNQSADATHVIANIAIPGTIGLKRQAATRSHITNCRIAALSIWGNPTVICAGSNAGV